MSNKANLKKVAAPKTRVNKNTPISICKTKLIPVKYVVGYTAATTSSSYK